MSSSPEPEFGNRSASFRPVDGPFRIQGRAPIFDVRGGSAGGSIKFKIEKGSGHVQAGGAFAPMAVDGPTAVDEEVADAHLPSTTTVGLVDVGLPPGWAVEHPWLAAAVVGGDHGHRSVQDESSWKTFAPVHEMFVAGLIRRVGPRLRIIPSATTTSTGDFDEEHLVAALDLLLRRRTPPAVVNLSLGCFTDDDREPEGLAEKVGQLADAGIAVVAAAGNAGEESRKFWPAASDGVFAVGALDRVDPPRRAAFSNSGPWVDVWAPGMGVVSSFVRTTVFLDQASRPFDGWASWSGTSFSAPIFAALVAARVADDPGLAGRKAALDLLSELPSAPWGDARVIGGLPQLLGLDVTAAVTPSRLVAETQE